MKEPSTDPLTRQARQRLLARHRTLVDLARQRLAHPSADARREVPPFDPALVEVLVGRERAELEEVEAAIVRLADGTWGRCETCGGPIGRQRLVAVPEARRCLACSALVAPRL